MSFTLLDQRTGEIRFDGSRCTRRLRCPICDHDSWCMVDLPRGLVICPRTESDRKIGEAGWMHSIGGDIPAPQKFVRPSDELTPLEGADAMQARFLTMGADRLHLLCLSLGLSLESLRAMGTGWNGTAWTFPMRNWREEIVGFRTRTEDGQKFAIKGSRSGLFIPAGRQRGSGLVWIVEGPTDVAAMVEMGLNAIGRPSCRGCEQEIVRWTRGMQVVVVADNDDPGIAGAESLIQTLHGSGTRSTMVLPPFGMKDSRMVANHHGRSTDWMDLLSSERRNSNGRKA